MCLSSYQISVGEAEGADFNDNQEPFLQSCVDISVLLIGFSCLRCKISSTVSIQKKIDL